MLRWYAAILRILSPKILAVRAWILEVFRTGRERPIGMGTIPREITRTQRSRVVIWKQKWICHRFTLSFMHDTRCNLLQHNNYQTLGASLRLERRRWRDVLHLNNYGEDHEYEHIYSWICIHDPVPDWLITSWICTYVMTQFSISWFFNEYAYVSWPLFLLVWSCLINIYHANQSKMAADKLLNSVNLWIDWIPSIDDLFSSIKYII